MAEKKRAKPAKKSVDLTPFTTDGLAKICLIFVIPAKAGIQVYLFLGPLFSQGRRLDSCFRRSDGFSGFLREHHYYFIDYQVAVPE